jgi:hypothetical protein
VRFEHEHIDMYLKPGTADHYRSSLRLYILPALGDRPLDEITTADIQRIQNSPQVDAVRGELYAGRVELPVHEGRGVGCQQSP